MEEIFRLNDLIKEKAMQLVGPIDLPADLTMQQLRVLTAVAQEPGLTGHDLGARLGVSAPTASGLIDRLVEKGMVVRNEDVADRRIRRLHLTEDGVEALSGMDTMMGRLVEAVIPPTPIADLQAIKDGTEAVLRAVEAALTRLT